MKYRKLRLAFSATSGIICLLLVALWVRSYHTRDQLFVRYSASRFLWIVSERGRLVFVPRPASNVSASTDTVWLLSHDKSTGSVVGFPDKFGKMPSAWRLQVMRISKKIEVHVPQWMPVALTALLAAAPIGWKWSYSLRTLLIVMTLVAVVLGAVVWAVR